MVFNSISACLWLTLFATLAQVQTYASSYRGEMPFSDDKKVASEELLRESHDAYLWISERQYLRLSRRVAGLRADLRRSHALNRVEQDARLHRLETRLADFRADLQDLKTANSDTWDRYCARVEADKNAIGNALERQLAE